MVVCDWGCRSEIMAEAENIPLTIDSISRELREVDTVAEDGLEMSLCAPVSERHATRAGRTRAIVECWLSGDPTPSWRRLVWALEECWECQTADKVKPNVEPLTDSSLTAENVTSVLETVEELSYILNVPLSRRILIGKEHSTKPQQRQAAVDWWLQYSPTASWTWLAGRLYLEENTALRAVTQYIRKGTTDSTLNPTNLFSVLSTVRFWWNGSALCYWLQVPQSVVDEIQQQDSDATQQKKTLLERWLWDHPAPSWAVVAEALYQIGERDVLEQVKKTYITGVKSLVSCCLSVVMGSEQLMVQLPSLPHRLQHQIKNAQCHAPKFTMFA